MTGPTSSEIDRRATAADWCVKLSEGFLTAEEEADLQAWLAQDCTNEALLLDLTGLWDDVSLIADRPEIAAIRAEARAALQPEGYTRRLIPARSRLVGVGVGVAASLALIVAALWMFLAHSPVRYQTGIGERRVVQLPDGSRLSLDAATRIEARYDETQRSIRLLAGRAKFDVAKDSLRPFSVTVGGRVIVATGTAFSVEVVRAEMRVVLYEGHVAVLKDNADKNLRQPVRSPQDGIYADRLLEPGKVLVAEIGGPALRVEETDLSQESGWENNQLILLNEPLSLAIERVNRHSETKLIVADAQTGRLAVSGVFNAGDAAAFVEAVSALYPVAVTRSSNAITLQSATQ